MKVYHGSDVKIETIDLSKCRIGTDFGHGFYVTVFLKQAEDIAARVASWYNQIDETQATDLFYNSETFGKLADENTGFHLKSWQEIYEILKKEILHTYNRNDQ